MGRRAILHVDMDAFYASVEQRDNHRYRNRPVIVGADPQSGRGRGVVSAASYEARKYGIHSAMPISQAYRLCPKGVFLPVRMNRYVEVSEHIFKIFFRFTNLVEPLSLDEAFLDVSGSYRLYGSAETIGRRIQNDIYEDEGLQASVGVASNKFVAKVASDLKKPKGFVVVPHGEEERFLDDLPVERLWGAGSRTAEQLHRLGCTRIGDVARQNQEFLRVRFGKLGTRLWSLAKGIDSRPVVAHEAAKTISAESTFLEDTDDSQIIAQTLLELSERLAQRLRAEGVKTRTLTLKHRNEAFETVTRSLSFQEPTDHAPLLYDGALKLLIRVNAKKQKVRLLGLAGSKLSSFESDVQMALFEGTSMQAERLDSVIDEIRHRFGDQAIKPGSLVQSAKGKVWKARK